MKAACKFPKRQPQHQWYNNNEQKKKEKHLHIGCTFGIEVESLATGDDGVGPATTSDFFSTRLRLRLMHFCDFRRSELMCIAL